MKQACMYTRTSSVTNVAGDSRERQQVAIIAYAQKQKIRIVAQASDDSVCGSDPIASRPGLFKLINYCIKNNIPQILIERSDRLSRDQITQELGYLELKKHDIEVVCVDSPEYFTLNPSPSQTMIRQILGAVSQFEKDSLVDKLRGARSHKRDTNKDKGILTIVGGGKCEGRKSLAQIHGADIYTKARKAYREKRSYTRAGKFLAQEHGITQKTGKPLTREQMRKLCINQKKS